jgi:OmpA-OmpF porin, OOP family
MRILINGFLILLIWAIPCRYWYVCKIKHHCYSRLIEPTDMQLQRAMDLALEREGEILTGNREQFHFGPGAVEAELTADNESFLDQLAARMKQEPGGRLMLTGATRPSEAGQTVGFYENLGLARAAWIRTRLVGRGVPEAHIGLNHLSAESDALSYPLRFSMYSENATTDKAATASATAFTITNMAFSGANFASNSAVFQPNPGFIAYADSVSAYLGLHPDNYLIITGHTDSRGDKASNQLLGQRRADAVREWLTNRGVKARIETRSAGQTEPIADNDSEDGRARNRRVHLQIK